MHPYPDRRNRPITSVNSKLKVSQVFNYARNLVNFVADQNIDTVSQKNI